jgi:hypothetical protein
LKGFLAKNNIPTEVVTQSDLLMQLVANKNTDLIERDINGVYHFNSDFKNANDLNTALTALSKTEYAPLVEKDKKQVLQAFENVFNHKAFTGRSGTFYGYEGLGSIYWHMVSKLQLAVFEYCQQAVNDHENPEIIRSLLTHYYEVSKGIGVHKSPALYGAFPTDPYSHTPAGKGAQQPGMTGQVKEDILSRFGELGVSVKNGKLCFNPCLLQKNEFISNIKTFEYIDVLQQTQALLLEKGSLCFTYCQVPIVYALAAENSLTISYQNGTTTHFDHLEIDVQNSLKIFERTGEITQINIQLDESILIL